MLESVQDRIYEGLSFRSPADLVILDDIFPHPLSAFRIAEYGRYLRRFPRAEVHSTAASFSQLGTPKTFRSVKGAYEQQFPDLKGRVRRFRESRRLDGAVAYTMFLANAHRFLPTIARNRMPLVFTLYPGGGFLLEDSASDEMLRSVCSYPRLEQIIVTQVNTRDYLLRKGFCEPHALRFVYGGVFPSDRLPQARTVSPAAKELIDICFVAHKYMPGGRDKGYDVFIDVARRLARVLPHVAFHVVGGYDETDADLSGLIGKLKFYGAQDTSFFEDFYTRMDLILSPNAPFVRRPGLFDGFPTGACMEAGMSGVAVFCTDDLGLNMALKDREEIVLITRDPDSITKTVSRYCRDLDALRRLQLAGQQAFRKAFDIDLQMAPRLEILSSCLSTRGRHQGTYGDGGL